MRASQMFPSRNLKAIDLLNPETNEYREATLTVDFCKVEPVGADQNGDQKPMLHFRETKKILPLNKTNLMTLASNLGDETDEWDGQRVTLYVTQEPFNGQVYDVVRVKPKPRTGAKTAAAAKTPPLAVVGAKPSEDKGFDPDEIPF